MKAFMEKKRLLGLSFLLLIIYGVLLISSYEPLDEQLALNPIEKFQSAIKGSYQVSGVIAIDDLVQLGLAGEMTQEDSGIKQTNFQVEFSPSTKAIPKEFMNQLELVKQSMEVLKLSATLKNEMFTIYPSLLYSETLSFPIKLSEIKGQKVIWMGFRTIKSGKQREVVSCYTLQGSMSEYIYKMNYYMGKNMLYMLEIEVEVDKKPVLDLQIKKDGCS